MEPIAAPSIFIPRVVIAGVFGMVLRLAIVLTAVGLALGSTARADTPPTAPGVTAPHKPSPLESRAADGVTQVMQDRCEAAAASLKSVYSDPGFAGLEPHMRAAILEGADICEARLGHLQAAYDLSRRAIQEPEASSIAWGLHIDLAMNLSRPGEAMSALIALARRSPAVLAEVKEGTILSVYAYAELLPNADARRLELLEALDKAAWAPKDPFEDLSGLKIDQIRLLLAAHREAEARTLAAGLTDPATRVALVVDDRFAPVAEAARSVDVNTATRRELVRVLLLANTHNDWLSGPYRIATLRLRIGDNDGALRVLQSAIDRYNDFGASAFTDADEAFGKVQGLKAETLARMGRLSEADGAFAEAAADAGIDQRFEEKLSYASYLIDTDRAQLAIDMLHDVRADPLTDTGRAYLAAMRLCAYSVLGDTAAVAEQMKIVKSPAAPDYGALINGLICAGDLDGAAKTYIERLADPAKRMDALLALQHYKRPPTHGKEDAAWEADYLKVQARPDVQAAVKAAGGHVEDIDIFDPGVI
jgi:tetratricopeptide (TPR) repeat protein